jgi:hypothetical protein
VVQFKSGSAGSSTFFIRSKSDYAELFNKYAKFLDNGNVFPVKVSKFIKGLPITVNACVASQGIYVGEPCFQITGEEACASSKSATCGNDWSALRLSAETIDKIANITETVGRYFKKKNYRGIFGLDFILGERDKDIYLIEFNSRLVASVPFYTKLEIKSRGIPLLALHILEFLDINYRIQDSNGKFKIIDISGAQLVLRNKDNKTCFIAGEFKSGVCRFTENKLEYLRPGYSPEDLASPEELIVLAAPKGRMIMPGSEMAKIESLNSIVSKEYRLRKEISDAAAEIYKKLKPTPL